ncbi:hypothetical protein ACE6H2_022934 [Prunus campanulata]
MARTRSSVCRIGTIMAAMQKFASNGQHFDEVKQAELTLIPKNKLMKLRSN